MPKTTSQTGAGASPRGCAVIIVNYNAGPLLLEAVNSAQATGATEVIVVDNGSVDDSLEALEQLPSIPGLTIVRNNANLGFAKGCNIGVAKATAPALMFLNPDCRLEPGALVRLESVLWSDDRIGMVGPLLLNPDRSEQRGGRRRFPTPFSGFFSAFGLSRLLPGTDFNDNSRDLPHSPQDVQAISGGAMMVRRAAVEAVGPWDEAYFLHVEDLDYCMRFGIAGWRVVFVPDAVAVHVKGASSRARPVFVEWHKHKGMARFYDKFYARRYTPLLILPVKAGIWLHFALVSIRSTLERRLGGESL